MGRTRDFTSVFFFSVVFFTSLLQKLKHFGAWFPRRNLPSVSILTEWPADAFSPLCIISLNIIVQRCQSPFLSSKYLINDQTPSVTLVFV